jgi:hypothetical protein
MVAELDLQVQMVAELDQRVQGAQDQLEQTA